MATVAGSSPSNRTKHSIDVLGGLKRFYHVLRRAVSEFSEDNCTRLAAALSYYTVFALPAVMVIVIGVAGAFVDPDDIQGRIEEEISGAIGKEGALQVRTMIEQADKSEGKGGRTVFGIVILLIGATGVVGQLQGALNEAWGVTNEEQKNTWLNVVFKRLLSLAMILGVAFILIVSLLMDTVIVAFGQQIAGYLFPDASRVAMMVGNVVGTYLLFTVMFALMYKYLPDVDVVWKNVWLGASITALLFVVGKWVLSFYLAHRDFTASFGAAGSLALILVWVYYSGIIFLFGAEFIQVWSNRHALEAELAEAEAQRSTNG